MRVGVAQVAAKQGLPFSPTVCVILRQYFLG